MGEQLRAEAESGLAPAELETLAGAARPRTPVATRPR